MQLQSNFPEKIDILVVLFDIGLTLENSAVFQSQVLDQALALNSFGFSVGLVAMYKDREKFNSLIGNKLSQSNIYFEVLREKSFLENFFSMSVALRKFRKNTKHAYVRGLWGPLILKTSNFLNPIPHIYDVRGDLKDEFKAVRANKLKQFIYTNLEAWGIRTAHSVTAVTKVLAKKVSLNSSLKKEVAVIPCCINYEKFVHSEGESQYSRSSLGFSEDDLIFVYSGGLSHYQQVPAMLSLWEEFVNEPNIGFLLLTNEDPHSHPVTINGLAKFGDKLKHLSVERSEIPGILSLANVGFMLRDSRSLNSAASPVKFPEYLASGLMIAASPGTGDASNLILEKGIGVLIDPSDLLDGKEQLSKLVRSIQNDGRKIHADKAKKVAKEFYDWNSFKSIFMKIYSFKSNQ